MIARLVIRVCVVSFGFFCATLVAALFFVVGIAGTDALSPQYGEPMWEHMAKLFFLAGLVASFAGIFASVPVLLAAIAAEAFRLRGLTFNLATGAVIGVIAVMLWGENQTDTATDFAHLTGAASGSVGAFVYWVLAGRLAGKWRDQRINLPSPEEVSPQSRP
ncbi:MAG: hypothetical protein AAF638_12485 [Pseudomonadota bacterium]